LTLAHPHSPLHGSDYLCCNSQHQKHLDPIHNIHLHLRYCRYFHSGKRRQSRDRHRRLRALGLVNTGQHRSHFPSFLHTTYGGRRMHCDCLLQP
jgi:hypothetical protein